MFSSHGQSRLSSTTCCNRRKLPGMAGRICHRSCSGRTKSAILNFAVAAIAAIAVIGAISSYFEKYLTTSVSQWVTHDLRTDAVQPHSEAFPRRIRQNANGRSDQPSDERHRRGAGFRQFSTSWHPRQRIDAGGHGRSDVLHQLAIHSHRAFDRTGSFCRWCMASRGESRKRRGRCGEKKASWYR